MPFTATVLTMFPEAFPGPLGVSLIGTAPLFLAVHAGVKANTLDELIAQAKAEPGKLNYGSSGNGSIHHLTAEAMNAGLGIQVTHVPFRGSANSIPAMVGGQVDMAFASPPSLMGFVNTGKVKLLAINSAKRSPLAPNVPTLGEKIPGFDFAFNVAVLAKAGTPPAVVQRLNVAFNEVLALPRIRDRFREMGMAASGGSPEELAQVITEGRAKWRAVIERAAVKLELPRSMP